MRAIVVLFAMLFLHVVDDFYLQGILATLKQREWWKQNCDKSYEFYKYDYIVALIVHSFSWSFMVHLPLLVANYHSMQVGFFLMIFIVNMVIHGVVDDLKANKLKINLVADQYIHFCQIVFTWIILCGV